MSNPKIGDNVFFFINGKMYTDVVSYVKGHIVEGKMWDLTYVDFVVGRV